MKPVQQNIINLSKNSFVATALWCNLLNILASLSSTLSSILLAKYGGASLKGSISSILVTSALLSLMTNPGSGWYISDLLGNNEKSRAFSYFIRNQFLQVIILFVLTLFLSAGLEFAPQVLLLSVLFSINTSLSVIALNYIGPLCSSIASLLQANLPLLIISALINTGHLNITCVVLCYVVGFTISIIFLSHRLCSRFSILLHSILPKNILYNYSNDLNDLTKSFRRNLPRTLQYSISRLDVVLVNYLLGPEQAGIYSVGYSTSELFMLAPNQLAINIFTKLKASQSRTSWIRCFMLLITIISLCAVASLIISPSLIAQFYGDKFEQSQSISQITTFAASFLVIVRLIMLILRVSDNPGSGLASSLIVVATLFIAFLLVYQSGLTYLALAYTGVTALYLLTSCLVLFKSNIVLTR